MSAPTLIAQGRRRWREFRQRSVYFQWKALLLAVYTASVVLTVAWVVKPRGGGRNDLGARVVVLPGDAIMGRYFIVQNDSRRDWLGVTFAVDGGYTVTRETVLAGEKVTLLLRDFARPVAPVEVKGKGKGKAKPGLEHAPPGSPVTALRIDTKVGRVVYPVLERDGR